MSAGAAATCAELSNGTVRCWGSGQDGRLGSRATDNRLDGAVDPATGTDEASIVPIGALRPPSPISRRIRRSPWRPPQVQAQQAAAAAAAKAAAAKAAVATPAAAPLSFKVGLKGRKLSVAALMAPAKAGTCPKTVNVVITQAKKKLGAGKLKATKKGTSCRVAGKLKLRRGAKRKPAVTVTITARASRGACWHLRAEPHPPGANPHPPPGTATLRDPAPPGANPAPAARYSYSPRP